MALHRFGANFATTVDAGPAKNRRIRIQNLIPYP